MRLIQNSLVAGFVAISLSYAPAIAGDAQAASDKKANHRAEKYYVAAGKTYNMHAHDHARMLGKYAAAHDAPVPSEVVREHVQAIDANVARARQSYTKLNTAAKTNPAVAEQLAEIEKQLKSVTAQVNKLKSASNSDKAETKAILAETDAISKSLKATHDASKEIDQALTQAIENNEQFDNRQSDSYYFTGEGHFLD
jgi:hypothetical protein